MWTTSESSTDLDADGLPGRGCRGRVRESGCGLTLWISDMSETKYFDPHWPLRSGEYKDPYECSRCGGITIQHRRISSAGKKSKANCYHCCKQGKTIAGSAPHRTHVQKIRSSRGFLVTPKSKQQRRLHRLTHEGRCQICGRELPDRGFVKCLICRAKRSRLNRIWRRKRYGPQRRSLSKYDAVLKNLGLSIPE